MIPIKAGDSVRHKKKLINRGLEMTVIEVRGDEAQCDHFEPPEAEHKTSWLKTDDLEIIVYGTGGFKNAGEG